MSLLNNVLKDIETQRKLRQRTPSANHLIAQSREETPKKEKVKRQSSEKIQKKNPIKGEPVRANDSKRWLKLSVLFLITIGFMVIIGLHLQTTLLKKSSSTSSENTSSQLPGNMEVAEKVEPVANVEPLHKAVPRKDSNDSIQSSPPLGSQAAISSNKQTGLSSGDQAATSFANQPAASSHEVSTSSNQHSRSFKRHSREGGNPAIISNEESSAEAYSSAHEDDEEATISKKYAEQDDDQNRASKPVTKEILPMTIEEQSKEKYERLYRLAQEGKTGEAIEGLKVLTDQDPDFTPAQVMLIKLLISRNDLTKAYEYVIPAEAQSPNNPEIIELKARILFMQSGYSSALRTLQSSSPDLREHPDYYALMALIQQKLGNSEYAAKLYERLLKTNSRNANWWLGLAVAYENLGDNNAAVGAYQRALKTGALSTSLEIYAQNKMRELRH
ncbi:MAG: tetratricopeptide repeat protein [Gammaproteobacteria bacterium]